MASSSVELFSSSSSPPPLPLPSSSDLSFLPFPSSQSEIDDRSDFSLRSSIVGKEMVGEMFPTSSSQLPTREENQTATPNTVRRNLQLTINIDANNSQEGGEEEELPPLVEVRNNNNSSTTINERMQPTNHQHFSSPPSLTLSLLFPPTPSPRTVILPPLPLYLPVSSSPSSFSLRLMIRFCLPVLFICCLAMEGYLAEQHLNCAESTSIVSSGICCMSDIGRTWMLTSFAIHLIILLLSVLCYPLLYPCCSHMKNYQRWMIPTIFLFAYLTVTLTLLLLTLPGQTQCSSNDLQRLLFYGSDTLSLLIYCCILLAVLIAANDMKGVLKNDMERRLERRRHREIRRQYREARRLYEERRKAKKAAHAERILRSITSIYVPCKEPDCQECKEQWMNGGVPQSSPSYQIKETTPIDSQLPSLPGEGVNTGVEGQLSDGSIEMINKESGGSIVESNSAVPKRQNSVFNFASPELFLIEEDELDQKKEEDKKHEDDAVIELHQQIKHVDHHEDNDAKANVEQTVNRKEFTSIHTLASAQEEKREEKRSFHFPPTLSLSLSDDNSDVEDVVIATTPHTLSPYTPRTPQSPRTPNFSPAPTPVPTTSSTDCPICLNPFSPHSSHKQLPCRHDFHLECLRDWFNKNPSCPCCRRVVHLVRRNRKASGTPRTPREINDSTGTGAAAGGGGGGGAVRLERRRMSSELHSLPGGGDLPTHFEYDENEQSEEPGSERFPLPPSASFSTSSSSLSQPTSAIIRGLAPAPLTILSITPRQARVETPRTPLPYTNLSQSSPQNRRFVCPSPISNRPTATPTPTVTIEHINQIDNGNEREEKLGVDFIGSTGIVSDSSIPHDDAKAEREDEKEEEEVEVIALPADEIPVQESSNSLPSLSSFSEDESSDDEEIYA